MTDVPSGMQAWPRWLGDPLDLARRLRLARFAVTIADELRLRLLVERLQATSVTLGTADDVVNWIAPVLCRNPDQRIRLLAAVREIEGRPPRSSLPGTQLEQRLITGRRRRIVGQVVGGLGVLLIIAAAAIFIPRPDPKANDSHTRDQFSRPRVDSMVGDSAIWGECRTTVPPNWPTTTAYFGIPAAALPIALYATFLLWRQRRRQGVGLTRRLVPNSARELGRWLPTGAEAVFRAERLRAPLGDWRRHRWVESNDIDIIASLNTTIKSGGLSAEVRGRRRISPEYLILVERVAAADHLAALAEVLVRRLHVEQLDVVTFEFRGDPRWLTPVNDRSADQRPPLRLDDVLSAHGHRQIIILADPDVFFDLTAQRHREWVDILRQSPAVVAVTPREKAQWSSSEGALAAMGWEVVEGSPRGIAEFGRSLRRDAPPRREPFRHYADSSLDTLLAVSPYTWLSDSRPSDDDVRELMENLRRALDQRAFLLLASIAVFPVLDLRLTLYVSKSLFAASAEPQPIELLIGQVARLPWLRHGRMPEWLRLELVGWLQDDGRDDVREAARRVQAAWLALVSAAREDATSGSAHDAFRLEFVLDNMPEIKARLRQWVGRAGRDRQKERILLSFIDGKSVRGVVFGMPESWRELLRRGMGPARWLGWSAAAGLGLAVLLAATKFEQTFASDFAEQLRQSARLVGLLYVGPGLALLLSTAGMLATLFVPESRLIRNLTFAVGIVAFVGATCLLFALLVARWYQGESLTVGSVDIGVIAIYLMSLFVLLAIPFRVPALSSRLLTKLVAGTPVLMLASGVAYVTVENAAIVVDMLSSERAPRSVSGEWRGTYTYADDIKKRVEFIVAMDGRGTMIAGIMSEPNTFESTNARNQCSRFAGSIAANKVAFTKTYDGRGGPSHSVAYVGTIDQRWTTIEGGWTIKGKDGTTTGTFVMRRR